MKAVRGHTGWWVGATIAVLAAIGVVIVAATTPLLFRATPGRPQAADDIDANTPTNFIDTSSATITVQRVPGRTEDPTGAAHHAIVATIVGDLNMFWAHELPETTGHTFAALPGGLTAIDAAVATTGTGCVPRPGDIAGNAFYCSTTRGIVYDSSALIPVLLHRYGGAGVVSTFAHEFGHVVQAQLKTADSASTDPTSGAGDLFPGSGASSLFREAQADCFAGTFWTSTIDGDAPGLHFTPAALPDAIGPLADFADPPGTSPGDPAAHGFAVDRVTWFLTGYRQGAAACLAMTPDTLHSVLSESASFNDAATLVRAPRFEHRTMLLTAATRSIEQFADTPLPSGNIAPAALDAVAADGQFAEATTLALAMGRAARDSATNDTADRSARAHTVGCFAGSWVRAVYGHTDAGLLGSWAGDADAGLAAARHATPPSFDRIVGYLDGFHHGRARCRATGLAATPAD